MLWIKLCTTSPNLSARAFENLQTWYFLGSLQRVFEE